MPSFPMIVTAPPATSCLDAGVVFGLTGSLYATVAGTSENGMGDFVSVASDAGGWLTFTVDDLLLDFLLGMTLPFWLFAGSTLSLFLGLECLVLADRRSGLHRLHAIGARC